MAYTSLQVKTPNGVAETYYAAPPKTDDAAVGVIMYPDAFMLRPAMAAMAERLASHGYAVLVPNVLYRAGKIGPFDPLTTWEHAGSRDELMALLRGYDDAAAKSDAAAWIDALHAQPGVKPGKVGATGYCLGGRLATLTACAFPERVAAAASFHGGWIVNDGPASLDKKIVDSPARFYFGVADNDNSCTPEAQERLKAALRPHHPNDVVELYAGAPHGFAMSDGKSYRADAAERHWQRMTSFFAEAL